MRPPIIPIARPWMGEAEAEAARRVILSGWITQGPEVAAFEEEFAGFVGAPLASLIFRDLERTLPKLADRATLRAYLEEGLRVWLPK